MAVVDAELAYTYAWWLTGQEDLAEAAVRTAADGLEATNGDRLPALLARVREAAVSVRTMCPASELALLHDGQGLALDEAACIAVVDLDDARTELAHGRLEALAETVTDRFEHPERLGGLAVGNPADVAHARQCETCARARELLVRGREELRALPRPPLPESLATAIPELVSGGGRHGAGRRALAAAGLAAAVLVVGGVVLARAPAEPEQAPGAAPVPALQEAGSGRVPVVEADVPAEPADGAFRVVGAGLVDISGLPLEPGEPLPAFEPLRLAVRYEGASAGVVLSAHWSVAGQLYRDMRVVLSGRRSTHVFGGPAPADGWPPGDHEALLSVDGEVVGAVHFSVAG